MGYRRREFVEVQMYPFLNLAISWFGRSRPRTFCYFPGKKPRAHCRGRRVSPQDRIEMYEEEKNFFSLSVFKPQTVPPAESNGRIKEHFGFRVLK
jgi:hypothetical protein